MIEAVDPALDDVANWLARRKNLRGLIAVAVQQSFDDVIDGPRTGRWSREQLEKTEKIYIGTRVEILVRSALELERTGKLDTIISGHCVDFKWSHISSWEFPTEAIDEICLLIGARRGSETVDVGLIRPRSDSLNPGTNKDKKATLSARGRAQIRWIERAIPLPINFLASLQPDVRQQIMAGRSGQERVRLLFHTLPRTQIPRLAIETVAQQKDPMRRLRSDSTDRLRGLKILSTRYERERLTKMGFANLARDHFVAVKVSDLDS